MGEVELERGRRGQVRLAVAADGKDQVARGLLQMMGEKQAHRAMRDDEAALVRFALKRGHPAALLGR